MYVTRRMAVALLAASALAGSATTAVSALGDQGGKGGGDKHRGVGDRTVLSTSLAPSVPTDPTLLGVAPGAVPWMLRSGEARLRSDGRLLVRIRGLVIPGQVPPARPAGPVMTITASLYCGGNTTPVDTTAPVPLSANGNARIRETLTLPAKCQIPALLIHPNGIAGAYIASSGFGG